MSRPLALLVLVGASAIGAYLLFSLGKKTATPSNAPFPGPVAPGHTTT